MLVPEELLLYEQTASRVVPSACRRWLEQGRAALTAHGGVASSCSTELHRLRSRSLLVPVKEVTVSTAENKATTHRFIEAMNAQDEAASDAIATPEVAQQSKEGVRWVYATYEGHRVM